MAGKGPIFALDLGVRTGFAVGADAPARSGFVLLKSDQEPPRAALGNMIAWLNQEWTKARPALVVKEAPLPLQGFKNAYNAEATVVLTYKLHGIVEAMSHRFAIPLREAHPATIRKHFIGIGRTGKRQDTKAAVIRRCQLLGYMPKECFDADRADAIAIWSFFAAITPSKLYLFGETAA